MKSKEVTTSVFLDAYDQHADAIYRHCLFRVFSKERAEEFVQETFLRTWEYLEKGNEVENIRAFLYRVASNLIIDASRKKKEASVEKMMEEGSWEPSRDDRAEIEAKIEVRAIREVMEQLHEEDREIITLRFVDELDPREIAAFFRITPNAASVRISRAIDRLRKLLSEHDR
ncbi:MAG: sigma-70 family RNA polymerase sigma factor [Patescibacteria group bacterium]|mgnify:CR=1 FL=1